MWRTLRTPGVLRVLFVLGRAAAVLALAAGSAAPLAAACTPSTHALCLLGGRFQATVHWRSPNAPGGEGEGVAVPLNDQTGAFWFFQAQNYELIVKAIDGRDLNESFWIFFGALTDVEFRLTVTDTETGQQRFYDNPAGHVYGVTDTDAFPPRGAFCGGIGGFPCPEGQACDLDPGRCDITDPAGTCVDVPQACAEIFAPVCGCNGETYSNDCLRLRAGVPRDHNGPCAPGSGAG